MSSQVDNWVSNPNETHGPLMSTACWSLGGVAFSFLVVRSFIRQSQGKLWVDDIVLATSWVSDKRYLYIPQPSNKYRYAGSAGSQPIGDKYGVRKACA
jgi:hypothetical protein